MWALQFEELEREVSQGAAEVAWALARTGRTSHPSPLDCGSALGTDTADQATALPPGAHT